MHSIICALNEVDRGIAACQNLSPDSAACLQVNIAAMRVACSIHGLRPPVKGVPRTVAALIPGTRELALAGEGALLQVFDPTRNRHVDKVQVGDVQSLSKHISDNWGDTQRGPMEACMASTLLQNLHNTLMLEVRLQFLAGGPSQHGIHKDAGH